MVAQSRYSGYLGPLLVILTIVLLAIWLSRGSSNQAQQRNWISGWQTQASFHLARRAPAAVAHNGYLYVIGGIDGVDRYVMSVEYAPILADGQLGQWQQTRPIKQGRFYNAAVAYQGYLYTLGGGSGATGEQNHPIASVERSQINSDGSLGEWQTISRLLTPRRGLKTVIRDNTIYAIGGYDGHFLKSVERTSIQADGMLGDWQIERHESIIDRYIHSAALAGDTIYLLGGHMRNPNQASYSDVESSRIQPDKQLSPWQLQTHGLLMPRLVAESFSLGRFLYIAGGHTGSQRLTSVEVAAINSSGQLTPWRQTTPLPIARSAYAAATDGTHVFLLGGGGDGVPLNSVVMATTNPRGDLGYRN